MAAFCAPPDAFDAVILLRQVWSYTLHRSKAYPPPIDYAHNSAFPAPSCSFKWAFMSHRMYIIYLAAPPTRP